MRRITSLAAVPLIIAVGLACSVSTASAAGCDRVASPSGSDSATGTAEAPFRTVGALVGSLAPGQTGCLRSGVYAADTYIPVTTAAITLTSAPGERATIRGLLEIPDGADGVTISNLTLDGTNPVDSASPIVNADNVTFRDNDITNRTEICLLVSSDSILVEGTLIEGNRIHDCGERPSTNMDHGIYVDLARNTTIRDNVIFDNVDRGIQLRRDAQQTLITGNVIDGNGEGILFSGDDGLASSNNLVEHNVITYSAIRHDVESYWPVGNPIGTNNIVRSNCIYGGRNGEIQSPQVGFIATDNVIARPRYTDRARKNFTLRPSSRCLAVAAATR